MAGRFKTGKVVYHIIEKNYLCRLEKLDLIAKEDDDIVFFEVRDLRITNFGIPAASMGIGKRRRTLSLLVLYYFQIGRLKGCRARFDVVTVSFRPDSASIDLIHSAFDLAV